MTRRTGNRCRIKALGRCGRFFLPFVLLLFACDDTSDEQAYRDFGNKKTGPGMAAREARAREKGAGTGLVEGAVTRDPNEIELPALVESVFVAGPKHRDPFAPFLEVLIKKESLAATPIQREVKLKEYDISELKLIGIITNIGDPRAMVTTPDKTGFVLRRGDYVGRADFVRQNNSSPPIQVNWRVARIHGAGKEEERGIYLVRDDPTTTKGADVTRFIPLHPID